jgi:hypothetical protein
MSDRQDSDAITDMQEEIAALRAERDEALRNGRKTSEQADTVARELIAAEARAERAERAVLDEDRARRDAQAECSRLWEALDRLQRNFDAEVALVVRLRGAFGMDLPTPVHDLLDRLAAAAVHLLDDHNCDQHGWEGIERSVKAAREAATRIRAALSEGGGEKP